MGCLKQYLSTEGKFQKENIIFDKNNEKIQGFRETIRSIKIESAAMDGVKMLQDLRSLCDESQLPGTFSYSG